MLFFTILCFFFSFSLYHFFWALFGSWSLWSCTCLLYSVLVCISGLLFISILPGIFLQYVSFSALFVRWAISGSFSYFFLFTSSSTCFHNITSLLRFFQLRLLVGWHGKLFHSHPVPSFYILIILFSSSSPLLESLACLFFSPLRSASHLTLPHRYLILSYPSFTYPSILYLTYLPCFGSFTTWWVRCRGIYSSA